MLTASVYLTVFIAALWSMIMMYHANKRDNRLYGLISVILGFLTTVLIVLCFYNGDNPKVVCHSEYGEILTTSGRYQLLDSVQFEQFCGDK